MIYAELTGGLGNQMFVYAFARALSLRCREPVTLIDRQDWQGGAPVHTVCALGALRIPPEVRILPGGDYAKRHLPLQNALKAGMIRREQSGGMMARDWHPFEAKAAPWLNRLGLHFVTDGYIPCRRGPGRHLLDLLAWGYFQGEAYFADFRDAIRAELRPAAAPDPDMAAAIAAAGVPVCLHIRRGDYQNPENAALQVCTPAYYARCCRILRDSCPDAELVVFSDDILWAQDHLDTAGLPARFVDPGSAAGDLALMQMCRHFVISNSTYSWWAQYLGDAPDKQVLAPDRWYANGKQSALYLPGWQLVRAGQ